MNTYYVYIITNNHNSTFYIGVTGNLKARIYQHKNKLIDGFSKDYNLEKLVYIEETTCIENAIKREKQLKKWNRKWKLELIQSVNPGFEDLFVNL